MRAVMDIAADGRSSALRARVLGMDCGSCALSIEDGVRQVPGVSRVVVDFTTETIEVEGTASREAIEHRVRQLGYRLADKEPEPAVAPTSAGYVGFFSYLWSQGRQRVALFSALAVLIAWIADSRFAAAPGSAFWVTTAAVILVGAPIFAKGVRALLFSRRVTIELLMTVAAFGALWIDATGEAAAIVLLFTLGEGLEGFSAARARDSLRSLLALQPQTATVLRQEDAKGTCAHGCEHPVDIPAAQIVVGDRLLVKPGQRVAADGTVRAGTSTVNQAAVTGESTPVLKAPGDEVLAGSINVHGTLEVEVSRPAADSTLARIAKLVQEAQAQRSPAERFIDRFARWYTPAVVLLALLVVLVPVLGLGEPLLDTPDGSKGWLYRGLTLLIVACPCALIISIPVTVVSSLTRLSHLGILVKGGEQLDKLADVHTIAFDKTGTLTVGRPVVTAVQSQSCTHAVGLEPSCAQCNDVVALAASVAGSSEHPLSRAILDSARDRGVDHQYPRAQEVVAVPGRGIAGMLAEQKISLGSQAFMRDQGATELDNFAALRDSARTITWVARGDQIVGGIGIEDPPRPESAASLDELHREAPHVRTVMLTGDNERVARSVAARLGAVNDIRAGLLPADKLEAIQSLQSQRGTVAMVGDGINDAPALARADVGIAMGGSGTAQAMETADVVLMRDDLRLIPLTLRVARRNRTLLKQNIALSLGLKFAVLALAIPGWATLWLAVVADVGATLLVTANGMRMLRTT